jgi:cytoskeleton protein RodZ
VRGVEDSEVAVTSVGKTLTAARLASGRGIDDLSEATRIRGTLIEAIEHDNFDACGADVYARGHVKALAVKLGLDPAPLIERYDEQRGVRRVEHPLETAGRRRLRWPRRPSTDHGVGRAGL